MLWHQDRGLEELPLAWARAENVRRAEVYVRPARGYAWPLLFMDDVPLAVAARIARKYATLVVHTSPAGGCHRWLKCLRPLVEEDRHQAQRWLAQRMGADLGSVSGEHLGRLAGFKNWKRGGVWVNVLELAAVTQPWDPCQALTQPPAASPSARGHALQQRSVTQDAQGRDSSESGREWGWVGGMLESEHDPRIIYHQLVARARPRRRSDAERYARTTLRSALRRVCATS